MARLMLLSFSVAVLLLSGPARAGGTCEPETKEDFQAEKALKHWRKSPKLRPVLKGLCSESTVMQQAARTRLRVLQTRVRSLWRHRWSGRRDRWFSPWLQSSENRA